MSNELDTGKFKSRVIKRTYGDGTERWVLQTSVAGFPFQDKSTFNRFVAALMAMEQYNLEKAQEHVVSEEVVA